MADDASATPLPPDAPLPASTKRRRLDPDGRDLKRVAEIVMVLAAMGQMRGSRDPSPAERSLVAEARRGLVDACESLRPNDLFTSEAARVIAGDLGFNHQVGVRLGRKIPIAEKVALTKKKMEEGKDFATQPPAATATPNKVVHPQGSVAAAKAELRAMPRLHSVHRAHVERPSAIPQASAGFHTVLPVGHSATNTTTWKQMPFGETQHSVAQLRPPVGSIGKDSAAAVAVTGASSKPVRPEVPHFGSNVRPGGPPYPFQVQGLSSGGLLPVMSTSSPSMVLTSAATMATISSQVVKPHTQNPAVIESSHGVNMTRTFPPPTEDRSSRTLQTTKGNASHAEHFSQNENVSSAIANNIEIAKTVYKFLQPKAIDLSGWIQPSLDYMSHPLSCQICKITITDTESLLVCDACEKGVHLRCLKSFNQKALTNKEWHCPNCLLACNGKTLPPKYGKVTRSIGVPRPPPNTAGSQVSPETRPEIPHVSSEKRTQISDPKVVTTGIKTRSSQRLDVPNMSTSSSIQKPDTQMVDANEGQDKHISLKSTQVDTVNLLDKGTCSNQTAETERDDIHSVEGRKNLGPSPCSIKGSNPEFTLNPKTDSLCSPGGLLTAGVEIRDQPDNTAISKSGNDAGLPLISMSMGSSKDGSGNHINKEPGGASGLQDNSEQKTTPESREEICENSTLQRNSDNHNGVLIDKIADDNHSNKEPGGASGLQDSLEQKDTTEAREEICKNYTFQSNLDNHNEVLINKVADTSVPENRWEKNIINDAREKNCDVASAVSSFADSVDGVKDCKPQPPLPVSQNVDWVGEALRRVDGKSYYRSCSINDVVYRLQDHVCLDNCKLSPSKLQALWEDVEDGSKWAMLSRCYFPSDIPDAIIRPAAPESNEVYESNDSYTVEAGKICGPSVVVNLMKFNEESEMQMYLVESKNASDSIFTCRWFYDKSNELFLPL